MSLVVVSNFANVQTTLSNHKRMEPGRMDQTSEHTDFYSINKYQAELNDNRILFCEHIDYTITGNIHVISFYVWLFYIA